jgi:hypothetical protein
MYSESSGRSAARFKVPAIRYALGHVKRVGRALSLLLGSVPCAIAK